MNDVPAPMVDMPKHRPALSQDLSERTARDQIDGALIPFIRAGLGMTTPHRPEPTEADWTALCAGMGQHRLGGLVWSVMVAEETTMPVTVLRWFTHFRDVTTRMNGANLLTMRRVMPRLQAAGIPALAFKGPVLQQMAYGAIFHRPASDVDILVRPEDFGRAGQLLSEMNYELARVCRSLWWKMGLGEQHFSSNSSSAATLDLHHRVQQPGCPLPRRPDRFFEQSIVVAVGGQDVSTLSYDHTILLTAMSYAKALHHREPAARYAIDFVALGKDRSPAQWRELEREADLQGLGNTLALTIRAATALVGRDSLPMAGPSPILERVSDETLVRMTLAPEDPAIPWPRRRELLYALCDRKSRYLGGLAAMVGSDLLRQAAESGKDRPRLAVWAP